MRQRNTLTAGEKYRVGKWLEANHAKLSGMTPEDIYEAIFAEHQIRIPDKVNRAAWLRKLMADIGLPDTEFKRLVRSARVKRAEEWALFKRVVSNTLVTLIKQWGLESDLPGQDFVLLYQWATEPVNGRHTDESENDSTSDDDLD